jgi:hypothetical protein
MREKRLNEMRMPIASGTPRSAPRARHPQAKLKFTEQNSRAEIADRKR